MVYLSSVVCTSFEDFLYLSFPSFDWATHLLLPHLNRLFISISFQNSTSLLSPIPFFLLLVSLTSLIPSYSLLNCAGSAALESSISKVLI